MIQKNIPYSEISTSSICQFYCDVTVFLNKLKCCSPNYALYACSLTVLKRWVGEPECYSAEAYWGHEKCILCYTYEIIRSWYYILSYEILSRKFKIMLPKRTYKMLCIKQGLSKLVLQHSICLLDNSYIYRHSHNVSVP